MSHIFISYRRKDSSDVTGRIFDHLKARFGEGAIFKDVNSIGPGEDFPRVIEDSLRSCKVLLAVIGDDWLDISNPSGERRIDDPKDHLRFEIETALRLGIPVVPVLVEHQPMPEAEDLPDSLKQLVFRNAAQVRTDPDFESDFKRLADGIECHLPRPHESPLLPNLILGALATIIICLVLASTLTDILPAPLTRRMLSLKWTIGSLGAAVATVAAYIKWKHPERLQPDKFAFLGAVVALFGVFANEPSKPSRVEIESLETVLVAPDLKGQNALDDEDSLDIATNLFRSSTDPFQLGLALLRFGEIEDSLKYFEAASSQANYSNDRLAKIHYYKGNCLLLLERYDEALEAYDAALKRRPEYVEALNNKGLSWAALEEPEKALAVYERALAVDSSFPQAWFNKASTLSDLGRLPEAEAMYNEGKRLWPTVPYAWNRGVILRICVDRVLGSELDRPQRLMAISGRLQAVFEFRKRWMNGSTLSVSFLGGDAGIRRRVQEVAIEWSRHGNIQFEFVEDSNADIRISFDPGPSWAYVGTDANSVRAGEPTLNLGWLTPSSTNEEYAALVLHEFGHALGFGHEHRAPADGIKWDEVSVKRHHAGPPNFWNDERVKRHFFNTYESDLVRGQVYDDRSIMRLPIPAAFTLDGYEVGWNSSLSEADKRFVGSADAYPGRT